MSDSVNPRLEGEPRLTDDEARAEMARLEAEHEAAKARRSFAEMARAREAMQALAEEFGL